MFLFKVKGDDGNIVEVKNYTKNSDAILKKYVFDTDENIFLKLSPRFLYIKSEDYENDEIEVESILTELDNLSLEDLQDEVKLNELLSKYYKLTTKDIIIIFLIINGYADKDFKEFNKEYNDLKKDIRKIYARSFNLPKAAYDELNNYKKNIAKELEFIKKDLEKYDSIMKKLSKGKDADIELQPFILEDSVDEIFVKSNDKELYNIFNDFKVSKYVPYIVLVDGKKKFTKIFDEIIPPIEWINKTGELSGNFLYFYVLNTHENSLLSKKVDYMDVYSSGSWNYNNVIRQNYKLGDLDKNTMLRYVIDSVEGGYVSVYNQYQLNIKGKFLVENVKIVKEIFADMIMNDPVFKHFTYIRESDKSILNKPKYTFYYDPGWTSNLGYEKDEKFRLSSLTITMSIPEKQNEPLSVRVSKAKNINRVNEFMGIFKKLLGLYETNKVKIARFYDDLYPKLKLEKKLEKSAKGDENKKSGKRLLALQKFKPEYYKQNYATKCQRERQPYIVDKKNLKKVKKILAEVGPNFVDDGLLQWPSKSGEYYACYPREDDDKDLKIPHIFPGLIEKDEKDEGYDVSRFLPCCFTKNQYSKGQTALLKYIQLEKGELEQDEEKSNVFILTRPLGERKMAPPDKPAELPTNLQVIAGMSDVEMITRQQKTFMNIFRIGVEYGYRSFVYCMENVKDSEFSSYSSSDKEQYVQDSLDEIADMSFSIARQELYGVSDEDISKHLMSKDSYIDPDLYISLFEKYYNVNIILFEMDDESKDGDISIPRHSIVYLMRKLNPNKRTVLIVKHGVNEEWNYQCELIVKYDNDKNILEYSFDTDDTFIENIRKIYEEINSVYTTTITKYDKYIPTVMI